MAVTSKSNRREVEMQLDAKIKAAIEGIADEVLRDVQESYRAPKTGRIYRVGATPTKADRRAKRRFRGHRASAPGEAPAIDTVALRKGTTRGPAQRVGRLRWVVSLGVTSQSGRADVSMWLEKGTSRIRPRPAWAPAIAAMRARRLNLKK